MELIKYPVVIITSVHYYLAENFKVKKLLLDKLL